MGATLNGAAAAHHPHYLRTSTGGLPAYSYASFGSTFDGASGAQLPHEIRTNIGGRRISRTCAPHLAYAQDRSCAFACHLLPACSSCLPYVCVCVCACACFAARYRAAYLLGQAPPLQPATLYTPHIARQLWLPRYGAAGPHHPHYLRTIIGGLPTYSYASAGSTFDAASGAQLSRGIRTNIGGWRISCTYAPHLAYALDRSCASACHLLQACRSCLPYVCVYVLCSPTPSGVSSRPGTTITTSYTLHTAYC